MAITILVGRILFSLLFLGSAMGHLMQADETAEVVKERGLPMPKLLAMLSGVQIAVGGMMIALGAWADLGALILLAFVLPAAFLIHPFWKLGEDQMMVEMPAFMKNIAISGALVMMFGFFSTVGPDLDLMLTDSLFDLDLK